ncbi:hypothetical protein EV363DRAFT_364272 [Boletus edulis]|nr:hypothetical protein EV363DRAFT_364272 [Boletus edulis]
MGTRPPHGTTCNLEWGQSVWPRTSWCHVVTFSQHSNTLKPIWRFLNFVKGTVTLEWSVSTTDLRKHPAILIPSSLMETMIGGVGETPCYDVHVRCLWRKYSRWRNGMVCPAGLTPATGAESWCLDNGVDVEPVRSNLGKYGLKGHCTVAEKTMGVQHHASSAEIPRPSSLGCLMLRTTITNIPRTIHLRFFRHRCSLRHCRRYPRSDNSSERNSGRTYYEMSAATHFMNLDSPSICSICGPIQSRDHTS